MLRKLAYNQFSEKNRLNLIMCFVVIVYLFAVNSAIAGNNYFGLFGLISIFSFPLIINFPIVIVSSIVIIPPATDWACELGYLPYYIMWYPELMCLLLFIISIVNCNIKKKKIILHGLNYYSIFVVITIISAAYNGSSFYSIVLFLRPLLRYYFLYLAMINIGFNIRKQKLIVTLLCYVFLIQLPLSIVKLFVFGQGETPLSLNGHSTTTFVSLITIGYLVPLYLVHKRSGFYLLLAVGFVCFSLIGEKRATLFLIPFVFVHTICYLKYSFKTIIRFILLTIFIGGLFLYFSLRLIPTLNPQRQIWGEFDPFFALDYAQSYDTATSNISNKPIGRTSTTIYVNKLLFKDGIERLMLGFGPGAILKSRFSDVDNKNAISERFGIGYGLNGLTWIIMQIGYLGLLLYLLFYFSILRKSISIFYSESDKLIKAMALGTANYSFIILVIAQYYSPIYLNDSLSVIYFSTAGIIFLRFRSKTDYNQHAKRNHQYLVQSHSFPHNQSDFSRY